MFKIKRKNNLTFSLKTGFTLMEVLISIFVFLIVVVGVLQAYYVLINSARTSRLKISATLIANEQIEIVRNLPYANVGVVGGIPSGILEPNKNILKDGASFNIKTTVRNVDDTFDGTIEGSPADLSPADYKLVDVEVSCVTCKNFSPVILTTNVSPKNVGNVSNNGALLINVFDALGQPIEGASVSVVNNVVEPIVNLSDITGVLGSLSLIDAIPSNQSYQVSVSKNGYSSEMTYAPGLPENPNPIKPHATVASKQITQLSFSIDKLSSLNISTVTQTCTSTPNVGFNLRGAKLLGTNPNVYKYDASHITGANAMITIPNLEWDTYSVSIPNTSTSTYFLAGTLPMAPFSLLPNTSQDLKAIVKIKDPNALLISVKDSGTGLPISGAEVILRNGGSSETLITGRGSRIQSDWSGGSGQEDMYDETKYFSSSGVNVNDPAGDIVLASISEEYESDGSLESSTFDTGSEGNFYNINWSPVDQPTSVGPNGVKFQIATNNDKSTWNYVGPDGTSGTYFTSSGESLDSYHSGHRYLRYKVFLHTDTATSTPNISSVSFGFTSSCVPSGQVFFDGLSLGSYELDASKSGYNSVLAEPISISETWQEKVILMSVE